MGKKKRGRPKLPARERQGSTITVRVSRADRKKFGLAAKTSGQKLSVWIRTSLLAAADQGTIESRERKAGESNSPTE